MLKHLNSHALLEVMPKLYCSTLCVVQHPLEIELFPLTANLLFFFIIISMMIAQVGKLIVPVF